MVRLGRVVLPAFRRANRHVVRSVYPTDSGDPGTCLFRMQSIVASYDDSQTQTVAAYGYLGAGTIVSVTHPAVEGGLTLSYGSNGTYGGWDRFGRVIDQKWTTDDGDQYQDDETVLDEYAYGYDAAGNRTYRANEGASLGDVDGLDELYAYDDLGRLTGWQRGDLNEGHTEIGAVTFRQDFTLDQLGNWSSLGQDDDGDGEAQSWTQTRTHDAANKLTGFNQGSGWATPAYDAAGNMIAMPQPGNESIALTCVYDAWGRLVKVLVGGPTGLPVADYEYDGLNRRIEKRIGSDTYDTYYNENWQALETYLNADASDLDGAHPLERFVWDLRYIDTPVVRFYDPNTDGDFADAGHVASGTWIVGDSILYYLDDANHNITAVFDGNPDSSTAGNVLERYIYTAYGQVQILNGAADKDNQADWSPDVGNTSDVGNNILFAGGAVDNETGLILFQIRYYHISLGRFVSVDPQIYSDGVNVYSYVHDNPITGLDPSGMYDLADFLGDFVGACFAQSIPHSGINKRISEVVGNAVRPKLREMAAATAAELVGDRRQQDSVAIGEVTGFIREGVDLSLTFNPGLVLYGAPPSERAASRETMIYILTGDRVKIPYSEAEDKVARFNRDNYTLQGFADQTFARFEDHAVNSWGMNRTLLRGGSHKGRLCFEGCLLAFPIPKGAAVLREARFGEELATGTGLLKAARAPVGAVAEAEAAGSRMALRAKYGSLSAAERQALIAEKVEANAERWLNNLVSQNPGAHFLSRHGAGTSLIDQNVRSMLGRTPDGLWLKPVDSSRFMSYVDQMHVMDRAMRAYRPGMTSFPVTMPSTIGEGFEIGGSPYFTTNQAIVRFGQNGLPYTAYPTVP